MSQNQNGAGQTDPQFEALKKELEGVKQKTVGTYTADDQGSKAPEKSAEELKAEEDARIAKEAADKKAADDAAKAAAEAAGNGTKDDEEDDDAPDAGESGAATIPQPDRKVIPIKRLHDEERLRKEAEKKAADAQKEVERLAALVEANKQVPTAQNTEAIKKWAEKNNFEEGDIMDLVNIVRTGTEVETEKVLKNVFGDGVNVDVIREAINIAKDTKAREAFNKEFKGILPTLKEQYPNATPEQLATVQEFLDKESHEPWGLNKDLDYILFKKKSDVEELLKPAPGTPERKTPKVKGPESGRIGGGAPSTLTVADFTGKQAKPFSELDKLPEADKKTIVDAMDPFTKQAYWTHSNAKSNVQGDILKRGGKIVSHL